MKCKVIGTTNGYFPIGTIVDVEIRTTHVLITGIIDCIKVSKQLHS